MPTATAPSRDTRKNAVPPLVLVVDDEADTREMYAEYLTFAGFRTRMASDGADALRKAEAEVPDVIVLDMSLPEMDGFSVARRLRGNPKTKNVCIIALTGHAEAEFVEKTKAVGCDEFIAKPCLPEHLMQAVLACLKRRA